MDNSVRGVFVTGTDTDIGKTVAAALLTLALDADYWKPVQSGYTGPGDTDTARVQALTGLPADRFHPSACLLKAPLSPHEAARLEGARISLSSFRLPASSRPLVVEGAGGLLVPLNDTEYMLDLAARLGLPVVLVARSGLGTINHTLLSLAALRGRHLPIAGVILNGPPNPANRTAIEDHGRVRVLLELPPLDPPGPATLAPFAECLRRPGRGLCPLPGPSPTRGPEAPWTPHVGRVGEGSYGTARPAGAEGDAAPAGRDVPHASPPSPSLKGCPEGVTPSGGEGSRGAAAVGLPEPAGSRAGSPTDGDSPAEAKPLPWPPEASADVLAMDRLHVWHPFTQAATAPEPVELVRGEGARLFAADGRVFLDLVSSWWVNIHGHAHPRIAEAVARQAYTLEQALFADFTHGPAARLADRLCALLPAGLSRVFYSDNGSTAVEVALKMAHQYWRNKGEGKRSRFLAFQGGYHGDTVGAMSVGMSSGYYQGFEPLVFPVGFLPYPATWLGDEGVEARERAALEALDQALAEHAGTVAGVLIEPMIQGAGGMRMCRPEFLRALADRLREDGALLLLDEVMTGFGRTGAMFACAKAGITPDIICLAKGLTGGFLPLSATVCREEVFAAFLGRTFDRAFAHGHSFTANPLGCAAGLASLEVMAEEHSLARVAAMEALHRRRLARLADRVDMPRVTGCIAAMDIRVPDPGYTAAAGRELKRRFMDRGLYIRPMGSVLYLMPPYCTAPDDLERAYDAIEEELDSLARRQRGR